MVGRHIKVPTPVLVSLLVVLSITFAPQLRATEALQKPVPGNGAEPVPDRVLETVPERVTERLSERGSEKVEELDWEGYRGGIFKAGEVYLAGQPLDTAAMQKIQQSGVSHIINLRTSEEMADPEKTPIDEVKIAKELGMNYLHLPSGGEDHPFDEATLDRFAEMLSALDGSVLLHCNSGYRATNLWVAYLIKYGKVPAEEAIGLGLEAKLSRPPIEGYLSNRLKYVYEGRTDR